MWWELSGCERWTQMQDTFTRIQDTSFGTNRRHKSIWDLWSRKQAQVTRGGPSRTGQEQAGLKPESLSKEQTLESQAWSRKQSGEDWRPRRHSNHLVSRCVWLTDARCSEGAQLWPMTENTEESLTPAESQKKPAAALPTPCSSP